MAGLVAGRPDTYEQLPYTMRVEQKRVVMEIFRGDEPLLELRMTKDEVTTLIGALYNGVRTLPGD